MYRASIASRGKNAAGLLRTMTTSYFRQVFKRRLMLAMTAISYLFHVYGGRTPLPRNLQFTSQQLWALRYIARVMMVNCCIQSWFRRQ